MWPRDLKIYPYGGDSITNVNRRSKLLRQIEPVGETLYHPVTSPATASIQGFLGEVGNKSKFSFSITVIFDHLIRTPNDRFRNQNKDALSHNDGWTHNQTMTKILAFHEINPDGVAKEIKFREFEASHNGRTFFTNQGIEDSQIEFLDNIVAFIGQRLSRYDTEYQLKKALEGDETKDLDSLMQGKMLAKELILLAKFTSELEKCGINLIMFATGKVQLGQWLRSFDLLRRKVPNFLMDWSISKILEYKISYTQLIGLPETEMVEIGRYFEKAVTFLSPNRATGEGRECQLINITVLKYNVAGKSHIWECCTPPNGLGGISTIWDRLAEIGNVKVGFNPNLQIMSNYEEWAFKDGFGVKLEGALLNHRQRLYVATHFLNSENFAPYAGRTEILVPADPNGNWNNDASRLVVNEINAYPLHYELEGKSDFKGAKDTMVEIASKLLTRMDITNAVESCGITPFNALGVKMRLKFHAQTCFKIREFDSEVCFKSQSGKLTFEIPRDMARDIANTKYNQLYDRAGPSGITQKPFSNNNSVKVNRALLTKGLNCPEWRLSKHRKMNEACRNAEITDSEKKSAETGINKMLLSRESAKIIITIKEKIKKFFQIETKL